MRSAVAVVSWPARRSVMSWSRISESDISEPSSKRAEISIERMSSRSSRVGVGAPLGDLGGEQLVHTGDLARKALVGRRVAHGGRQEADRARRARRRQDLGEALGELVVALPFLDAEDRAQDHLERDRLHRRVEGELLALAPAGDRVAGHLFDHVLVGAHALAVERRQHQLAAAQVLVALLEEQRPVAKERPQDDVPAGRDRVLAVARIEGLDRLGVRDEDHLAGADE